MAQQDGGSLHAGSLARILGKDPWIWERQRMERAGLWASEKRWLDGLTPRASVSGAVQRPLYHHHPVNTRVYSSHWGSASQSFCFCFLRHCFSLVMEPVLELTL